MKSLFRWTIPLIIISTALFFVGCAEDDDEENPPAGPSKFQQLAERGDAYLSGGTKIISADQLYTEIHDADTTQPYIMSLRSLADDTVRGRIRGARHWELTDLTTRLAELPAGKKIVTYCYSGQNAGWATCYLRMMGYDAWSLKWGMCGWTLDTFVTKGVWDAVVAGGQQLETTPHAFGATYSYPALTVNATSITDMVKERAAAIFAGGPSGLKYINASDVFVNLNDGNPANDPFLLCYWPASNYNAGHIPGAVRFQPGSLDMDTLKYIPPDKQIVVHCYSGQQSAQVGFYLRALGYDAYSMRFGMNAVTRDPAILGSNVWQPPTNDYRSDVIQGPY